MEVFLRVFYGVICGTWVKMRVLLVVKCGVISGLVWVIACGPVRSAHRILVRKIEISRG